MIPYINSKGLGKPLVFFHGWGFDHVIWTQIATAMQEQFTIYLVDLPGFGKSPLVTWETFKTNLLARLPPQFALVGWSMGGLFATRLALEVESRVTHLMNVTSSPYFIKDNTWPGIEKKVLDTFLANLLDSPIKTTAQFIELQLQQHASTISLSSVLSDPEALKAGLEILNSWDFRGLLPRLTMPTCYVFGRLDAIVPYLTMQSMQKIYPEFNYILFKKAAHIPFLSHKNEFISELEQFLR